MKNISRIILSAMVLCCAHFSHAAIALNSLIGDNMVLQQQAEALPYTTPHSLSNS